MPFFDNLRLYLAHFPGQEATQLEVTASHAAEPDALWSALHESLGLGGEGERVQVRGATGTVERVGERQALVRLTAPVAGMLTIVAWGMGEGKSTAVVRAYLLARRCGLRAARGAGLAGLAGRAVRAGLSAKDATTPL